MMLSRGATWRRSSDNVWRYGMNNCFGGAFDNNSLCWIIIIAAVIIFCCCNH
ncbi:MAG: hypothetical protein WBI55_03900 [Eubacteriales bacterium]